MILLREMINSFDKKLVNRIMIWERALDRALNYSNLYLIYWERIQSGKLSQDQFSEYFLAGKALEDATSIYFRQIFTTGNGSDNFANNKKEEEVNNFREKMLKDILPEILKAGIELNSFKQKIITIVDNHLAHYDGEDGITGYSENEYVTSFRTPGAGLGLEDMKKLNLVVKKMHEYIKLFLMSQYSIKV